MVPRLTNNSLSRILHHPLYERLVAFAQQYTPEFPAELAVNSWLTRLFNGDGNLHIYLTLEENSFKITGHMVADVQEAYGRRIIIVYQAQADRGNKSTLSGGIEYLEKLKSEVNAECIIFSVAEHVKAYAKKYGFKQVRTVMAKYSGSVDTEDE